MTKMLASVSSLKEAEIVLKAGVDIIDLKDPNSGALGAVTTDIARQVVERINGTCPISATIGDLPLNADLLDEAITTMANTGVDIVKVGVFGNDIEQQVLDTFAGHIQQGSKLVLVFFADQKPDMKRLLDIIGDHGFYGVMLDTANKGGGSLCSYMTEVELQAFVQTAKARNFMTGLAGSLRIEDIEPLLTLKPDYLGFRGALCEQSVRNAGIDDLSVYRIRSMIHNDQGAAQAIYQVLN